MSEEDRWERYAIDVSDLKRYFGDRICRSDCYTVRDLQSGQITENTTGAFAVDGIDACDNITLLITPQNPQR
ncbi:MAG: hypothetical protein IJT34_00710 [Butyrivibrio sp.]|nr:hypothetical protein [Butyrivibrio sp.]